MIRGIYEFEQDGKKYVAVEKGIDVYLRWVTWIFTLLLIVLLFYNGYIWTTHLNELRINPIEYEIERTNLDSCICYSKTSTYTFGQSPTTFTNQSLLEGILWDKEK